MSESFEGLQRVEHGVLPAASVKACCYNSLERSVPRGCTEGLSKSLAFVQESCSTKGKCDPLRSQTCLADLTRDFQQPTAYTAKPKRRKKPSPTSIDPHKEHQPGCLRTCPSSITDGSTLGKLLNEFVSSSKMGDLKGLLQELNEP